MKAAEVTHTDKRHWCLHEQELQLLLHELPPQSG
jgi:hypothetical protein